MSYQSVRNPDEKIEHCVFDGIKMDKLCVCGHPLSDHSGHPAMCQRCTCHQFYVWSVKVNTKCVVPVDE